MSKLYSNIRLFSQNILRSAACLIALFIFTAAASAATYTVDTTADNAALSACTTTTAGDCSLRGAVGRANATTTEADTIDFALPAGSNTITLTGGHLAINNAATAGALTITNSTGASNLRISGNNASGVFSVARDGNLTLNAVTVTMGNGLGAGINNSGTLSLTNSIVSGNMSVNFAGGIYASPSSTTTLTNSTVNGNTAPQGAGIYNGDTSTLTLLNSTVSGNTAQQFAGGIYNDLGGIATLTNSTVSGNSAPTGGGIFNAGTLNLTSVTVAFNSATSSGGGVHNQEIANLSNTIVAKNTGSDFSGAISSTSSFNLIGSAIDPKLDPTLAFNGGTTKTHALLPGSPAIDTGNATGTDQRGFTRPVDDPGIPNATGGNGADIGAFEAQPVNYTVDTTADNAALSACSSAPNDCSLRGAIAALNATIYNDTIDFALPAGSNTITLTGGHLAINNAATAGALTITNSTGASSLLISGNNASRVFVVNGGANLTLNAVTVTRGNTSGRGGGINNAGTLLLTNSIVSANTAVGNDGGGISSIQNTTLTLLNSTVSGNTSGRLGGGIATENGTFSLTDSTVSGNTGVIGGGIFNNNGTFSLTNSTVSGNTAQQDGGGIYSNATLNLTSVTVAFNSSEISSGGGVYAEGRAADLSNTIVAKNTGSDFSGAISSTSSFNLIGDGSGMSGITNGTGGNQVGIDPKLNPTLAFNGGKTLSHALLAGSPAIDRGLNTLAVGQTDQRGTGFARIRDGNGDGTPTIDIGAFEVQLGTTAATVSVSGRVTARGRGISNAVVHLTSQSGEIQTARTNRFGYYTFTELAAGETYIFNVFSKRYQFDPKVINLTEDLSEIDFTAQ